MRGCSAYLGNAACNLRPLDHCSWQKRGSRIVFAVFCEPKLKRRDTLLKDLFAFVLTTQNLS
jgi:hypothetical protein